MVSIICIKKTRTKTSVRYAKENYREKREKKKGRGGDIQREERYREGGRDKRDREGGRDKRDRERGERDRDREVKGIERVKGRVKSRKIFQTEK